MRTSPLSVAERDTQQNASRGLAIYFAVVVALSAVFEAIIISTGNLLWIPALMWTPAMASVVARLVLREGFADVSFSLGGRRGWKAIGLALVFPIIIGLIAYGIAWTTRLAQFSPQPVGLVAPLVVGASASPVVVFLIMLALAATIGTIFGALLAAGEEIGWRGYMLTRLIDAGVPWPVLASGLIWGLWHVPLILAGVYAAGPSPALSAVLFMVTVTSYGYVIARLRLETGSVWPAIALHAAWNSIILAAFDLASTGAGAKLWVGESGILVALTMIVAAVIFSRGQWALRRVPEVQQGEVAAGPAPQT